MIAAPKFAARINLKPLANVDDLVRVDPAKVLRSLRREVLKSIKDRILREAAFSKRAKDVLLRGFKVVIGPNSLTAYATDSAFLPLVMGQKSGPMTWLLGARAPVPIVLDSGRVIFRTPTAKSMKNGGWRHPGRKPTTILEQARREAREVVKKRIQKEIRRQIRASLRAVR